MNLFGFKGTPFGGIQLIGDPHLTEWVRRPILPKSRRKRIRRKWMRKYPQGAVIPKETVYRMGNALIAHPDVIEELTRGMERG